MTMKLNLQEHSPLIHCLNASYGILSCKNILGKSQETSPQSILAQPDIMTSKKLTTTMIILIISEKNVITQGHVTMCFT